MKQIEKATSRNETVLILGDINLCSNKWNNNNYPQKALADKWRAGVANCGVELLELGSTYFSNHANKAGTFAESALDHLYTNRLDNIIEKKVLGNSGTDHLPIRVKINLKSKKNVKEIFKRSMKNFNSKAFCRDLAMAPWEKLAETKDVNKMVEMYTSFINQTLDIHAPVRKIKIRGNYKSRLSTTSKKLMKKRDQTRKKYSKARGVEKAGWFKKYKKLRNECTKKIRKESIENSVKRVERSKNASEFWKIANEIGKPPKNREIILDIDGETIKEELKVSEQFNNFFIKKIKNLRSKLNSTTKFDPFEKLRKKMRKTNLLFSLKPVTESQIIKIVRSLNNTNRTGTDTISTKILKDAIGVLVTPITWIVNTSILTGTFPEIWKMAKVIPILKKGNAKLLKNYRPVSILNTSSKILEEAIRTQVSKFFETHNLFPQNQHGFRPKRSTTTALIALQNYLIENKMAGKTTGMLLWDLSAAFDTLDHEIFLEKIKIYGFDEMSAQWFASFLSNRHQKVKIGNSESGQERLHWGSPQGAILSPLIFTIYMADVELWMEFADVFGYADDTTTLISDIDEEVVIKKMQKESQNVLNFMNSNGLVANPDKTGLLFFRARPPHLKSVTLKVGGSVVTEAKEEKLLGVIIENDFKWTSHINNLQSCLNQRVALLRRLKQWLPKSSLSQVAQGLILSKIRYGLPVFGQVRLDETVPLSGHCRSLQTTINNLMRIIANKKLSDKMSIRDLHALTGLPSLNQMVIQATLMETWKMIQNEDNVFQKTVGTTRAASAGDLKMPKQNKGFVFNGTRIWNKTPTDLRNCEKINTVKMQIKKFAMGYQ